MGRMELRWLGPDDVSLVVSAAVLFDDAPRPEWSERFLSTAGHHLCLAFVDDVAAGFVSAVETTHPDKGTEMFLYELGVDERFRGRGIGAALVAALRDRARALGCYGMWVLTDADNDAAQRTYRAAGASPPTPQVMLEWDLS